MTTEPTIPGDQAKHFLSSFDFSQINFIELLCNFDQGILMTDDQGVLIFYNKVQANIDKVDPSEVLGRKIADVYQYHNDSSTCMRVLKHGRPIINYALSYSSRSETVGNTIHSVFPLFDKGKIIGTICIVKDYNILERNIPDFLGPKNNENFAEGTEFSFASIIGSAPSFVNALRTAKMASNSSSSVMLYGETGTGKELFAQAIHNFHYASQKHYVDVNCSAIPESLIEGTLFGTVKGAYTGAIDRAGLLELANGGTIFLDEINSMPLELQGKLLRALQERKIRRVGSLDTINLNCKVISSVNENPRDLVKNGTFRMDLFYRLAVVYIGIPPLRERQVDIEELGRHFLQKYNQMMGKNLKNISTEVIAFFWEYSWPGNVRELEHIIESAVNMAAIGDQTLELRHCYLANLIGISGSGKASLPPEDDFIQTGAGEKDDHSALQFPPTAAASPSLAALTRRRESNDIIETLAHCGGNISAAARKLGLSRQLLSYKIKKYGLREQLAQIKYTDSCK